MSINNPKQGALEDVNPQSSPLRDTSVETFRPGEPPSDTRGPNLKQSWILVQEMVHEMT